MQTFVNDQIRFYWLCSSVYYLWTLMAFWSQSGFFVFRGIHYHWSVWPWLQRESCRLEPEVGGPHLGWPAVRWWFPVAVWEASAAWPETGNQDSSCSTLKCFLSHLFNFSTRFLHIVWVKQALPSHCSQVGRYLEVLLFQLSCYRTIHIY